MKFIEPLLPIILIVICPLFGFTQTVKTIDSLEDANQHCLDEGKYMLGCEKTFYIQMDSLLNIVYMKLYNNLSITQKATLKKEQKLWLVTRDTYFKKTLKTFTDNNPGKLPYGGALGAQDDAMFMYHENSAFVEKRVIELMKKLGQ